MSQIVDFFKGLWKFIKIFVNLLIILILIIILIGFVGFAILTSPFGIIFWSIFSFYWKVFTRLTSIIVDRMNKLC